MMDFPALYANNPDYHLCSWKPNYVVFAQSEFSDVSNDTVYVCVGLCLRVREGEKEIDRVRMEWITEWAQLWREFCAI